MATTARTLEFSHPTPLPCPDNRQFQHSSSLYFAEEEIDPLPCKYVGTANHARPLMGRQLNLHRASQTA